MNAKTFSVLWLLSVLVAPAAEAAPGIAAGHPGDIGIGADPRVVFVESFEEESREVLWKRWETVSDRNGQSFSSDVPAGSAGKQSLVMERTKGPGAQLYRRLRNKEGGWGYERLFARYYVWLYIYTAQPEGHRIKVWFDDVVVATEYIGPIQVKRYETP